jgi:hypothetical protein
MGTSRGLAAFEQHGVRIARTSGKEACGACPWCGKRDKFFIETERLVWDCKVCGVSGNLDSFFQEAARRNSAGIAPAVLAALSRDRGGIKVTTFAAFGVGYREGEYTYPARMMNAKGEWKICDVRRYRLKGRPHSTSGAHLGIVIPEALRGSARVWVCEGEWDGMAWYQILRELGISDDVISVCGAGNFPRKACGWFGGKDVVFLFDNDQAGQKGCARAWGMLQGCAGTMQRLCWEKVKAAAGKEGFDVRDLCVATGWKARSVQMLLQAALTAEAPAGANVDPSTAAAAAELAKEVNPKGKGLVAAEVEKRYRKWLELPSCELLDVVFGAVFANRLNSDPLWLFLVGPPGSCKSEILMSMDGAPLVHCETSLTSHTLISGMNLGGTDPSLIPKLIGKTLIVKDFTTILSLNQTARDEIFGTLRDAYDGRTTRRFGNTVNRKYEGKFGIVGGVTCVIDSATHSNSVLGERFIKYRIRQTGGTFGKGGDAIMKALDNMFEEPTMRPELREAGITVLDRPVTSEHIPKLPQWFKERCRDLAHLVSALRGTVGRERYTQQILFKPMSEQGTRLAKQFAILASGIAVYRGVDEITEGIYSTICRVAMDTSPDRQEEIIKQIFLHGGKARTPEVAGWTRFPQDTCRYVLEDMAMLGLVERQDKEDKNAWRLAGVVGATLERLRVYEREQRWLGKGVQE